MRSRLAAALPLLLILACESPTAPEIEAVLPAAGGAMAAQATPSPSPVAPTPAPTPGSNFSLAVERDGTAVIASNVEWPAFLVIEWRQQHWQTGEWKLMQVRQIILPAQKTAALPLDYCLQWGRYEVTVPGHGLRRRVDISGPVMDCK
jgi:hypothetical protein